MSPPTKSQGNRPTPITEGTTSITWLCTACRQPISRRAGYLEVDDREVRRAVEADRRFKAEHPVFNVQQLVDGYPRAVPWLPWHEVCDPEPGYSGYLIEIYRIDSLAKLVHWAAHLGEKTWVAVTDWNTLLQEIGQDPQPSTR